MYGTEKETVMDFYPEEKLEAWIRAERMAALPSWITAEEKEKRDRIFASGYRGPTNWYKARFGQHLGVDEELQEVDPRIHCRTLYIEHAQSRVTLPDLWERTSKYADDCQSKRVSTRGHWVQLEAKDEVNAMLEAFFQETLRGQMT